MNWKGFLTRILLVAVTFPLFWVLIFVLPQLHHLAFNAAVLIVSVIGAFEMESLFRARKIQTSRYFAPLLAGALPVLAYLETASIVPQGSLWIGLVAALGAILVRVALFQTDRSLDALLALASSSVFVLLYPAFFLTYIIRLSSLPDASLSMLLFLCMVFGNDMSAYFAGSLWGRGTRLGLPVSPQKSAVGFLAGLAGSLIVVFLFALAVPRFMRFGWLPDALLALGIGATVILGDLVESGLKRSASVKDSGLVIPGRGGVLDSVDSMIFSAPLLYCILSMAVS